MRKETQPHAHRLKFETPNGETSRGVCNDCGYVARRKNSLEGVKEPKYFAKPRKRGGEDFSFVTFVNTDL